MKLPQEITPAQWPVIASAYVAVRLIRARPELIDKTTAQTYVGLVSQALAIADIRRGRSDSFHEEFAFYEERLCNLLHELEEELG